MYEDRHPSVREIMRFFSFSHLPEGPLRSMSAICHAMADTVVQNAPDSAELTAGLRKLLEAKDCFVRAVLPPSKEG